MEKYSDSFSPSSSSSHGTSDSAYACSSGSANPSTTLKEIGMDNEKASKTVRISFGKNLTLQNIKGLSKTISEIINPQTEIL